MNRLKFFVSIIAILIGFPFCITAQDLKKTIPVDSSLVFKQLENGLKYYIRKNSFPEKRAEFWLVVNAGAIQEDDDQDGLAHFCEHMAFNGTKNFKKHEIIRYLQSIGMKFGPEINAFTNTDATNFMLQNVPVTRTENIDTSLIILYDWACNVSFEDEEIEKERGVIHEEWRTRHTADTRMMFKSYDVLYYNSKYAKRNVIGSLKVIDSCKPEVLRRFYKDWYRPDLQAIIAVGDFDVQLVENKIIELFSKIPASKVSRKREVYTLPGHKPTFVSVETDREATQNRIGMYIKRPAKQMVTLKDYRDELIDNLFSTVVSARINEILNAGNPPFMACFIRNINLVRANDAFMALTMARPGEVENAYTAMQTEIERLERFGVLDSELKRAKEKVMAQYEKSYNNRNKTENNNFAWAYYSMFLNGRTATSKEFDYHFVKKQLDGISPDEIHKRLKMYLIPENRVITVAAVASENNFIPSPEKFIEDMISIRKKEIKPWVDNYNDQPLMTKKPQPGTIKQTEKNDELGIEVYRLSNGATVILKPTDFKNDEILLNAFSFGGFSKYQPADKFNAAFSADIAVNSGLGNMSKTELDKLLAGKNIRISPYVDEFSEGFSGQTVEKDLEMFFQLIYLYFTQPKFDSASFISYMGRIKALIANRSNDPNNAIADTFNNTLNCYNPYRLPLDIKGVESVEFSKTKNIYFQRFADAGDFTFVFTGSFSAEKIIPYILQYISSIPSVIVNEQWNDINLKPLEKNMQKEVKRKLQVPKSTVYIGFRGNFDNNHQNRVLMSSLNDILSRRLTETIREEESGTYGASVRTSFLWYPQKSFTTTIRFDCAPENAQKLIKVVLDQINMLAENGPELKYINDVKENKLKERAENLKKNQFWAQLVENLYFNQENDFKLSDYDQFVNNINQQSIRETAKKYFTGNNYVITVLVPE